MARSRDSVDRSPTSESTFTYSEFLEMFPDNEACLAYLKEQFYADGTECPKCGKASKFHRITGRSAYSCQYCGYHAYPTAGTIFHKSSVSLQLWFFAIYLMSSTRCGISAKQLEREIGVTYKTAHRMFKQIRTLLSDEGEPPLSGDVEVDESGYGGRPRAYEKRNKIGHLRRTYRPTMLAMVERRGRVRPRVIDGRTTPAIHSTVRTHVLGDSILFTDEYRTYEKLARDHYRGHKRIKHIAQVYVDGDTHTQTVEGFFGLFKNGVRGVYHSISVQYLQRYLDEYAFRYNRRNSRTPMFWAMMRQIKRTEPAGPAPA